MSQAMGGATVRQFPSPANGDRSADAEYALGGAQGEVFDASDVGALPNQPLVDDDVIVVADSDDDIDAIEQEPEAAREKKGVMRYVLGGLAVLVVLFSVIGYIIYAGRPPSGDQFALKPVTPQPKGPVAPSFQPVEVPATAPSGVGFPAESSAQPIQPIGQPVNAATYEAAAPAIVNRPAAGVSGPQASSANTQGVPLSSVAATPDARLTPTVEAHSRDIAAINTRIDALEKDLREIVEQLRKTSAPKGKPEVTVRAVASSSPPTAKPSTPATPSPTVASRQQAAASPTTLSSAPSRATNEYSLKSVVGQRAWITYVNDGKLFSVTVGDEIPGLGLVTKIDAETGTVSTAKGTLR